MPTRPHAALVAALLTAALAPAQTAYTRTGGTGLWSDAGSWSPAGIPGQGTGDTAGLPSVAADRVVTLDAGFSLNALGGLTIGQAVANVTNALSLERDLTVSAAATLTSTAGTAEVRLVPTPGAGRTLTVGGGLTVGPGGRLATTALTTTASFQSTTLAAGLTQTGGEVSVDPPSGVAVFAGLTVNALDLSGGTVTVGGGPTYGARLGVSNTFTATGGTVALGANARLVLNGASSTFGPGVTVTAAGSGASGGRLVLGRTGDQTLVGRFPLPTLTLTADGDSVKTVGSSTPGGPLTFRNLEFAQTAGGTTTLSLSTNLFLSGGSGSPITATTGGRFAIALNAKDLSMTASPDPWVATAGAAGGWAITSAGGAGTLSAAGFDFSAPSAGVTVGPDVSLVARGGNGAVLNLTNNAPAPYDPASAVAYAGSAAVATPAVLTTNRTLGRLAAGGNLRLNSPAAVAGELAVGITGRLELNGVVVTLGGAASLTGNGALAGLGSGSQVVFGGGATGGLAPTASLAASDRRIDLAGTFAPVAISLADTGTSRFDVDSSGAADQVNLAGNGIRYAGTLAVTLSGTLSTAGPQTYTLFPNPGATTTGEFSDITLSGGNSSAFTASFAPGTGVLTLTPVPEPGLLLAAAAAGLLVRRRPR